MLKLFLLLTLLTPESVRAHLEHKRGQGSTPSSEKLHFTRGCFSEIADAGCPHPRDGSEIFRSCLDLKLQSVSKNCQGFFLRLYGKRAGEKG